MAKFLYDTALDAALDDIINNASKLIICEGQPGNYTNATTLKSSGGNKLGEVAVAGGDFTKADGDTSGRKVTVAAKTGINIDNTGTGHSWDHVAIVDDTNTVLQIVNTLSSARTVDNGDSVDTNAFDLEIADVT